MIWTADRILYKGRARRQMGLDIAHNGRIRCLAPLDELAAPTHNLRGQAIVLGRINPYHHSLGLVHRLTQGRPVRREPVGCSEGDSVWDSWAHLLTPADMYTVARAAFLQAVMQGITCVGEVLSLHYTPAGALYPEGLGMADAIMQAAQDVGLRLGLIDNVRLRHPAPDVAPQPKCQAAPNLEQALDGFDQLVHTILARHDPKLSWALGAHSLDTVPYDSLVALRVRLGHMPFFLPGPQSSGAQARALRRYGQDPFVTLARRDVLDACMSIVTTGALPTACRAAARDCGAALCLSYAPRGPLMQTPYSLLGGVQPPGAVCVASGSADVQGVYQAFADWPLQPTESGAQAPQAGWMRLAQGFEHTQRTAAAALGVDAGDFGVGRWGDFVCMALPEGLSRAARQPIGIGDVDDEALSAADSIVHALSTTGMAAYLRAVIVGGQPIVQGRIHPQQAHSDAAVSSLMQRLAQSN